MAQMVTLLPLICSVSDKPIPTEDEIQDSGEKMDALVEQVRALVPEGVEVIVPTDPRYLPAILQVTTSLIDVIDPQSMETAEQALEALRAVQGESGGGPGPVMN